VVNNNLVCAAAFRGESRVRYPKQHRCGRRNVVAKQLDIDARHVYVTDDKGAVHAFDRTRGASVWRQDKLFLRGVTRPLAQGDVIAVGDYQGYVHLLRREDGAFVGRLATDGSAVQSELITQGKDGFVLQTANGGVFSIEAR
jgi:outer membrane protein assembly factor BamB